MPRASHPPVVSSDECGFQGTGLCPAPKAPKAAPEPKKGDGVDDAASLQKHAKEVFESDDESVASEKWALCEDIDSEHSSDSEWSPEKNAAEFQCVDDSLDDSDVEDETPRPEFGPPSVAVRGREVGTEEWVTYQSGATEAGDELDLDPHAITECASGNRKSLYGYEFQFIQPEQRSRRTTAKCAARTAQGGTCRGDGRARGATNAEGEPTVAAAEEQQPEVREVEAAKAAAAKQAATKAAAQSWQSRRPRNGGCSASAATNGAGPPSSGGVGVFAQLSDPDSNSCEAPQEFAKRSTAGSASRAKRRSRRWQW